MNSMRDLHRTFLAKAAQLDLKVECPMDGDLLAEVAICAQNPGTDEVAARMPLVGKSGRLVWARMNKYGYTRNTTYTTNLVKRKVVRGTKAGEDALKISKEELSHWTQLLLWELQQLPNLKYLLVMGGPAFHALKDYLYDDWGKPIVQGSGVNMWRGSLCTAKIGKKEFKVFITFNAAQVLYEPKTEIIFLFDMGKFDRVLKGKYRPYNVEAHYNPSFNEAIHWLDMFQDNPNVPLGYDIETMSGETSCVGFAPHDHEGYCINLRTLDANRFSLFEERKLLRRMQQLVADKRMKFIPQNGVFDLSWEWYKSGLRVHGAWIDTMLAHHTLYPGLPHSLAFLTAQYTDHPFYKDEGQKWKEGGNIEEEWVYNCKDTCIQRNIAGKLHKELQHAGLEEFFFGHVMRLQPHLVRMGIGGVKADIGLKDHINEQLSQDVDKLLADFHAAAQEALNDPNATPNPNSPKQMKEVFFSRLRLVGHGTSTGADNRKRMLKHPRTSPAAARMIQCMDIFKEEHKFVSTYVRSRLDPDDRFRCEYKQAGTTKAPGRLSSAKTSWDTGQNLQNQPERSKGMFIADDGYRFGYFDLEQAEARFVGWDYDIEKWMEDFERARLNPGAYDCHRALASDMWKIPYDDTPLKDFLPDGTKTKRYIAKRCRHGLNYRMQPPRLATTTGLSISEAFSAYQIYHRVSPEVKRGWEHVLRNVRDKKRLYNAFGRRWILLEKLTDESTDSVVAFRPQSSIGDKVCQVIYKSEEDDRWPLHARMALNVHDALICLAHEDKIKTCLSIMKKYAEEPMRWKRITDNREVEMIIPAECKATTQRMGWRINEETKELEYFADNDNGKYRWSHLSVVDVEAAA